MAFVEQNNRSRLPTIAAVALIHVGIGYAFISGLALTVIHEAIPVFKVTSIEEPAPPPPVAPPPPTQAAPTDRVVAPTRIVTVPLMPDVTIAPVQVPTIDAPVKVIVPTPPITTTPPPAQTSAARPRGDKGAWITTDDYPAAALRNGEEGAVGISVTIDARGRVDGCRVTQSSGHAALDEATCRLYAKRARFAPALDAAGGAVAASYADRIRWQIPQ